MTVLVVDNFDSFTYNLVEYLSAHVDVDVRRNTASLADIDALDPDAIVISPGPGHPKNDRDVGVTRDILRERSTEIPTLGVCLGMEAAVYEYGGTVGRAPSPVHGKSSPIDHDGQGVYTGLPDGFEAARYHSLVCTDIPDCFDVTATTEQADETIAMGVRHEEYPLEAVQFHPESVLTGVGHDLVANFLDDANIV